MSYSQRAAQIPRLRDAVNPIVEAATKSLHVFDAPALRYLCRTRPQCVGRSSGSLGINIATAMYALSKLRHVDLAPVPATLV